MIIRATNSLDQTAEMTYLSNPEVSGTNNLRVRNINPFTLSWAVQVGNTGEANAEIALITNVAPSGTSINLTTNTSYDHPQDTPVFATKYNQIVFERSTTGTTGTATPMINGTVTITPNTPFTQFDDTTGASTYGYRVYYLNSVTLGSTSESSWITPAGYAFYALATMRQRVKDKLVNASYIPQDIIIDNWLNEWLEMMSNAAMDVNEDYLIGTFQMVFNGTIDIGTITQTDFKSLKRVWYADPSGTYQATKMDSNSFSPNKSFTVSYPYFFMQGDLVLGRRPYDATGTFICEYYQMPPILVNDSDQLPASMWNYTKSFVDYAQSQALFKDQKIDEAQAIKQEASAQLQRFRTDLSPRNKTGVTYIDIVEDTASDQELWLAHKEFKKTWDTNGKRLTCVKSWSMIKNICHL